MSTEADDDLSPTDDIKASIMEAMNGGAEAPAVEAEGDDDETPPMQGFERARDEQGRFAPKAAEEAEPGTPDLRQFVDTGEEPPAEVEPQYAPPPGFSPQSKADWDKVPTYLKADIAKREQEVSDGFRQYAEKAKATEWVETLFKPYDGQLHASGMTREQIVRNWANAELALNRDPVAGIRSIMQAYGVSPEQLGGQPQAPYYAQQPQQVNPLAQILTPLQQQLAQQQQWIANQEAIQEEREISAVTNEIVSFRDEKDQSGRLLHPFYANVEGDMAKLVAGGFVSGRGREALANAYKMACNMRDDIRPHLLNGSGPAPQVAAAAKARQNAKSIRNSGGSEQVARTQAPALANHRDDIRESLRAAFAESTGSV